MDTSTSEDEEEVGPHYTESTTRRLFGGPLTLLFKARNFEPFTDPYIVFERVFGGPIFPRVEIEGIEGASSISTYNSLSAYAMVRPERQPYSHQHPPHQANDVATSHG